MHEFRMRPEGPFSLAAARDFAGGFAPGMGASLDEPDPTALLVVFPVEGWASSAAVELRQEPDGTIVGRVYGTDDVTGARTQALRCVSLDHDGGGWPEVGRRDPVIGALQERYDLIRPVCFLSAWEAATSFVIGHRIAMRQGAKVKQWLAETRRRRHRAARWSDGPRVPRPGGAAEADDRARHLGREGPSPPGTGPGGARWRAGHRRRCATCPRPRHSTGWSELPGIGPWTADAILMRGCGTPDSLPLRDGISRTAVGSGLWHRGRAADDRWLTIAGAWRPYRMWATVLLHMAWRREQPAAPSYRQSR